MRISNGIQNRNRRMRNRTYGGVRGRKTKVGRKLLRFPPTQFYLLRFFLFLSELQLLKFSVDAVCDFLELLF